MGFQFLGRPELSEALALMCPGTSFRCDTNPETGEFDYDHVHWQIHDGIDWTPPPKEEVEAYLTKIQDEWDLKVKYSVLRQRAYPDVAELADAIYWQQEGDNSKMEAYLQKVADVKSLYPKNDPTIEWRGSALGTIKGPFPSAEYMQNPAISLPEKTYDYTHPDVIIGPGHSIQPE